MERLPKNQKWQFSSNLLLIGISYGLPDTQTLNFFLIPFIHDRHSQNMQNWYLSSFLFPFHHVLNK
uniref:Uncharacterized protein n=1 Tax=Meloidogyne enterolobii TaxID=390850 RepID=A0A6V7UGE9_MELEN|nr:unnamed protein product [Meloidogyne enterolobii]